MIIYLPKCKLSVIQQLVVGRYFHSNNLYSKYSCDKFLYIIILYTFSGLDILNYRYDFVCDTIFVLKRINEIRFKDFRNDQVGKEAHDRHRSNKKYH